MSCLTDLLEVLRDIFLEAKGKLIKKDAKKVSLFINGNKGLNSEIYYTFSHTLLEIFSHANRH